MKIIVSGANFNNKGAQSMLFIVADEMRRRFSDCEISFLSSEDLDLSNYKVKQVYFSVETSKIMNFDLKALWLLCLRYIKEVLKKIAKKNYHIHDPLHSLREIKECDCIIDVSGYQLGDKWSKDLNYLFLNVIKFAHNNNIPIYLMPQSFGPFEYDDFSSNEKRRLLEDISKYLNYPEVVYAREKSGYEALKSLGVKEVSLSPDMVLQNTGLDLHNIFISVPYIKLPDIEKDSIGIVPNAQCFKFGNNEDLMYMYQILIGEMLSWHKTIYLIKHSGEDYRICNSIKMMFSDEDQVILLNEDYSCIEYDTLVNKFEFVISSRYHGAVHALRNGVPCMTLGWADKYLELMKHMGLEKYNFDISKEINIDSIVFAIREIINNYDSCKATITESLTKIRNTSCFQVFNLM